MHILYRSINSDSPQPVFIDEVGRFCAAMCEPSFTAVAEIRRGEMSVLARSQRVRQSNKRSLQIYSNDPNRVTS
jgi:hypothetical protein